MVGRDPRRSRSGARSPRRRARRHAGHGNRSRASAPPDRRLDAGAGEDAMFGFVMQNLMPMLLGVWSGWMIGQLSHHALGQYDLPLPLDGRADAALRRAQRRRLRRSVVAARSTSCATRSSLRETVHARAAIGPVGARAICAGSRRTTSARTRCSPTRSKSSSASSTSPNPEAMQSLGGFADAGALLGAMRVERARRRCSRSSNDSSACSRVTPTSSSRRSANAW